MFFVLLLLISHIKKLVLGNYWTVDAMMETPFFKKYMTQNRFRQLLRYLHFANNNQSNTEDRLWKIRNVFSQIVFKFSEFYNPKQKLVIDESLVLFKGRLSFKQYIPSKRHRFGQKLFVLVIVRVELFWIL